MKLTQSIVLLFLCTMLLTACHGNEKQKKSFASQQLSSMVFVKGGSFQMGPSNNQKKQIAPNNQPRHKVTLPSYYMNKYLVTWGNYDTYSTLNHLKRIDEKGYKLKAFDRAPNYPVTMTSWYQANNYCQYLGKITGLPFDLPTEAQWEYAARSRGLDIEDATNTGTDDYGKNTPDADQIQNQPGNIIKMPFPDAVGKFPPNPLGMYDMTGSVYQWTKNWNYSYPSIPQTNPQGPKTGTMKMTRGGGMDVASPGFYGVYIRSGSKPSFISESIGFRCVINSTKPMSELKEIVETNLS